MILCSFFIDNVIILLATQSYHLDIWLSYRKPCKDANNCLVDPSTKKLPVLHQQNLIVKSYHLVSINQVL